MDGALVLYFLSWVGEVLIVLDPFYLFKVGFPALRSFWDQVCLTCLDYPKRPSYVLPDLCSLVFIEMEGRQLWTKCPRSDQTQGYTMNDIYFEDNKEDGTSPFRVFDWLRFEGLRGSVVLVVTPSFPIPERHVSVNRPVSSFSLFLLCHHLCKFVRHIVVSHYYFVLSSSSLFYFLTWVFFTHSVVP